MFWGLGFGRGHDLIAQPKVPSALFGGSWVPCQIPIPGWNLPNGGSCNINKWFRLQQIIPKFDCRGDPRLGAGTGIRWQFDASNDISTSKIALRTRLSSGAVPPDWTTVLIQAATNQNGPWHNCVLSSESPYGTEDMEADQGAAQQHIRLRSRSAKHLDLQQDYAHVQIPAAVIEGIKNDGDFFLQMKRLDGDIAQVWHRDHGALLINADGSFVGNVMMAQLLLLARAQL